VHDTRFGSGLCSTGFSSSQSIVTITKSRLRPHAVEAYAYPTVSCNEHNTNLAALVYATEVEIQDVSDWRLRHDGPSKAASVLTDGTSPYRASDA
jgi:hypothetical protein